MGPGFFLAIKQNQDREKRRDRQREKEEWWLYQRGVENLARDLRMKSTSYLCTRTSTDNIQHQYLSCKQLLLLTLSYLTKSARRKTHTQRNFSFFLFGSLSQEITITGIDSEEPDHHLGFIYLIKWSYTQILQTPNKSKNSISMCQQQMTVSLRGSSWRDSSQNLHAKVYHICQYYRYKSLTPTSAHFCIFLFLLLNIIGFVVHYYLFMKTLHVTVVISDLCGFWG